MIGFLPDNHRPSKQRPEYDLSWTERAIYLDSPIDESLVQNIAPRILYLRENANDPITVVIDSTGGTVNALNSLLDLLKAPLDSSNRQIPRLHTVVTNQARGVATVLLANGDYSCAFPRSQISFDSIGKSYLASGRFGRKDPAIDLAKKILDRMIWVYHDQESRGYFSQAEEWYPKEKQDFDSLFKVILVLYGCCEPGIYSFNISGFVLALWAFLHAPVDSVINSTVFDLLKLIQARIILQNLRKGVSVASLANSMSSYREEVNLVFTACQQLFYESQITEGDSQIKVDAELLELEYLVATYLRHVISDRGRTRLSNLIPIINDEVNQLKSLESLSQDKSVQHLLHPNNLVYFLSSEAINHLNSQESEQVKTIVEKALKPQCELLWLLIAMFCRRLLSLNDSLESVDAQLLGIVDRVFGNDFVLGRDVSTEHQAATEN